MDEFPSSGASPFEFLFKDLSKLMGAQAQNQGDAVAQFAALANSDPDNSSNIDPRDRITFGELFDLVKRYLASGGSLIPDEDAAALTSELLNPLLLTEVFLKEWRAYIDLLQAGLSVSGESSTFSLPASEGSPETDGLFSMMGKIWGDVSKMLSGAQVGSVLGHLAQESFSLYDLPIGPLDRTSIIFNPGAVNRFSAAWSLEPKSTLIWLITREIAYQRIMTSEVIRDRLDTGVRLHLLDMKADMSSVIERFSSSGPPTPEALQALLGDPTALLGDGPTEAQLANSRDLQATLSVTEGIGLFLSRAVAERLLGRYADIEEALRRRRVEAPPSHQVAARLFGIEINADTMEAAARLATHLAASDHADELLQKLLSDSQYFPAEFELENPSLWEMRVLEQE